MKVTHRFEVVSRCPVDKKFDVYVCVVSCNRVIEVEKIIDAVNSIKEKELYQEQITQELHRLLACMVTTSGWHSGIFTTVVCGGK